MAGKPKWVIQTPVDGVMEVRLGSWKHFHDYVRKEMLDYSHYVWRGQRESTWALESALDRLLRTRPLASRSDLMTRHLDRFKMAVRGRRGPYPSKIEEENDWWALAQHNGMATPLLDWTESPFVALYFAFHEEESPPSGARSVWALGGYKAKNDELKKAHTGTGRPPILEVVRPHQDENARLVSQAGLFTRTPIAMTVDAWIRANYKGVARGPLIKIVIPNRDRPECLRTLNKMNINHLSLFPDIFGAGQHCNRALQIDRY